MVTIKYKITPGIFARRSVALLIGLLVVGGCTGYRKAGSGMDLQFAGPSTAWIKDGTEVPIENVRKVTPGLNRAQVYALLNPPHFSEGVFRVRHWTYLFNYHLGPGETPLQCEYMVVWDHTRHVESTHWKQPECAELAAYPKPMAAAPLVGPAAATTLPVSVARQSLSAAARFEFARSNRASISTDGTQALDRLARDLLAAGDIERVDVMGYADRLGSSNYNLALSLARARTVRQYLISAGLPSSRIATVGLGSLQTTAQCATRDHESAKACLAPDRHVDVEAHYFSNAK